MSFHRSREKFSALERNSVGFYVYHVSGIWVTHWTQALDVRLFSRDNYFVTQFLCLGDQKGKKTKGKY